MKKTLHIVTVQFGPIGDAVMALAFFDDVLSLRPDATILILARRNVHMLTDLARGYSHIKVCQIPAGLASVPFFISLLTRRWTLLTIGVAGAYSMRIKLFFFALTLLGNRTVGFDDRLAGKKKWLPLKVRLQFDNSKLVIENMRRLVPFFIDTKAEQKLLGRMPMLVLDSSLPPNFPYAKKTYIVAHLFGTSARRSLPTVRWIRLLTAIARMYPAYQILLTGSEADRSAAENIARQIPRVLVLINLPILEVAGIIDNAALYIGVDTGITHIAGLLQQKSVIISHFGDPAWLPTYNPNARVLANSAHCVCAKGGECFAEEDGALYRRCMYELSDAYIVEAVGLALASTERSVADFAGFKDEHA